jgi:hypothetical protein
VLPGSTRQDRRSISGAGWLLQGPQRLISALRFDDNGANLAASLNGLMRRGGSVLLMSSVIVGLLTVSDEARAGDASQYVLATANPYATDAGARVLGIGGSAVDAAVTIQMVLGVVEPQASGLGGGAIALYRHAPSGQVRAFDGLAKSPASYKAGSSASPGFSHSGASVGVPGSLRMLEMMHRQYGKLPWNTLFQRAIELADTGFLVSPYLARSLTAASKSGMVVPTWLSDGSGTPVLSSDSQIGTQA